MQAENTQIVSTPVSQDELLSEHGVVPLRGTYSALEELVKELRRHQEEMSQEMKHNREHLSKEMKEMSARLENMLKGTNGMNTDTVSE